MKRIGFYSGSFDPVTLGHLDVIRRSLKLVDTLVIGIGIHPGKAPLFTVEELAQKDDRWLEAQGRLTEPMYLPPGGDSYEPIAWDAAFVRIAQHLRALGSPDEAIFYTSGRTSNEAAFLWQLFARAYGTNNLPDCSNMCHESSGTGLTETIGEGKGTVGLEDFELCDLILVLGQNPGSNHPRMLTVLQAAKRRGCAIASVNPLRERGLVSFANPQEALGLLGVGTALADVFVQLRVGGDVAFQILFRNAR